jgi:biotin carboxylase
MREKIGLVDPVRTAKAFIPELERRGVEFVIVESGLAPPIETTHEIVRALTIDAMAEELRKRKVTQIIGCVDPSITYADRLCALVGVPFNGLRLSEARRNKARMSEALAKAGVRVPAQFEASRREELSAWVAKVQLPVVLKPVASGGTDNVHLCATGEDALRCFDLVHDKKNLLGGHNVSVLAQEYIDGTEYVIDCVSFDGVHVPIELFEYEKGTHNQRAFVYEKERYLRFEHPRAEELCAFARNALDALEFRVGASHMEVKLNSKGEIVFIEVGARLHGADVFNLVRDTRADGKSQLDYAIDAMLGHPPPPARYESARDGVRVYIISRRAGRIIGIELDEVERMPSYARTDLNVKIGTVIAATTDLSNDVGFIDLTHADPVILQRDEARLDAILRAGVVVYE